MKRSEILTQARDLISDPARWTRGVYARDAEGRETASRSESAVCWCVHGAIRKVTGSVYDTLFSGRYAQAALPEGYSEVHEFNDDPKTTHSDVLALFDRAIKLAKREE